MIRYVGTCERSGPVVKGVNRINLSLEMPKRFVDHRFELQEKLYACLFVPGQ